MADVFISYAREDRECAELLASELTRRGWKVWWDRNINVGRSFSETIERELDSARCVIVLWSSNSVRSQWVQTEASEAASRNALVPVRIEDVKPPLDFRRLQTADFLEWRQGFNHPAFEACIQSIEILAETATQFVPTMPSITQGTSRVPVPPQPQPPQQQQYQPPPQHQPQPQYQQQYQPSPPTGAYPVYPQQPPVPNYLVYSILVTLCCCMPLGIPAIYFASQVNTKLAAGDIAGARHASDMARTLCLIGAVGAFVSVFGWYFLQNLFR